MVKQKLKETNENLIQYLQRKRFERKIRKKAGIDLSQFKCKRVDINKIIETMDIGGNNIDILPIIQLLLQDEVENKIDADCEPFAMVYENYKSISEKVDNLPEKYKKLFELLEERQEKIYKIIESLGNFDHNNPNPEDISRIMYNIKQLGWLK